MNLLLDTHVLLWTSEGSSRLSVETRQMIDEPSSVVAFSTASIWELVLKSARGREHFKVNAQALRVRLLQQRYREIEITSMHALAVANLPPIHADPFDRMLIAQAMVEGFTLLTADRAVAAYPGPIIKI